MTAPEPRAEEPVAVRLARRLLDRGTPYTQHEREHLAFVHLPDILATLDAARVAAPSDGLLAEFDGSVCPACHCRAHDPGSCENCPRCELHTDEAAAFVLRYEPSLLAAPSDGLREALARLLDFLDDRIDQARAALATTGQPEPERPCPECGHPHGPLPEPWKTTDGHLVDPVCDWPEGDSACTCHWRGSAQPEDTRTADPGGLREALAVLRRWGFDQHEPYCVPARECTCRYQVYAEVAALTPEATAPGDELDVERLTRVLRDWMPDGAGVSVGFDGDTAHLVGSDLARFLIDRDAEYAALNDKGSGG